MNDSELIQLYWQREEAAIAETEKQYGPYCRAIARNILHSDEDAEECVNDAWLRVWNAIPPQRPARLKLFLARITRNLAFDIYKARSAAKRGGGELPLILDELAECAPDTVDSRILADELGRAVDRFVHTLPERECNVFVRRYFFAEPAEVIARRYALSPAHVTTILSRSRKKLRAYLEKEGYLS